MQTERITITIICVAIVALFIGIIWRAQQDRPLADSCEAHGGTYLWRDRVCVKTLP